MKKSAALVLTLLMMTSSAYAYENAVAGFSIKTKNPMVTIESQKFYGFTDVASNEFSEIKYEDSIAMHVVNYFNVDDMEKIVGEKFSTAYFNKQYEKLALLQRSELNLKTLPIPLMDFEKYNIQGDATNIVLESYYLKKMVGDIERHISIEKFGRNKGITSTAYIRQSNNLTIARTTVMSANDKLYLLTTTENYSGYFLSTDSQENRQTVGDIKQLFKIENVNPNDLDKKLISEFNKKHSKFAKSVKFSEPLAKSKKLSYFEPAFKKYITLPDSWFYVQTRAFDKDFDINMTVSSSVPMMQKLATNLDVMSLYDIFIEFDDSTPLEAVKAEAGDKATEELVKNAKAALGSVNSMLVTGSITGKNKEFAEAVAPIYVDHEGAELSALMYLNDTFSRLHGFSNDYIALESYDYDVSVGKDKAKLDLNVGVGIFKDLHFENNIRIASNINSATFLWLLKNKEFALEPEISKVMNKWEF